MPEGGGGGLVQPGQGGSAPTGGQGHLKDQKNLDKIFSLSFSRDMCQDVLEDRSYTGPHGPGLLQWYLSPAASLLHEHISTGPEADITQVLPYQPHHLAQGVR